MALEIVPLQDFETRARWDFHKANFYPDTGKLIHKPSLALTNQIITVHLRFRYQDLIDSITEPRNLFEELRKKDQSGYEYINVPVSIIDNFTWSEYPKPFGKISFTDPTGLFSNSLLFRFISSNRHRLDAEFNISMSMPAHGTKVPFFGRPDIYTRMAFRKWKDAVFVVNPNVTYDDTGRLKLDANFVPDITRAAIKSNETFTYSDEYLKNAKFSSFKEILERMLIISVNELMFVSGEGGDHAQKKNEAAGTANTDGLKKKLKDFANHYSSPENLYLENVNYGVTDGELATTLADNANKKSEFVDEMLPLREYFWGTDFRRNIVNFSVNEKLANFLGEFVNINLVKKDDEKEPDFADQDSKSNYSRSIRSKKDLKKFLGTDGDFMEITGYFSNSKKNAPESPDVKHLDGEVPEDVLKNYGLITESIPVSTKDKLYPIKHRKRFDNVLTALALKNLFNLGKESVGSDKVDPKSIYDPTEDNSDIVGIIHSYLDDLQLGGGSTKKTVGTKDITLTTKNTFVVAQKGKKIGEEPFEKCHLKDFINVVLGEHYIKQIPKNERDLFKKGYEYTIPKKITLVKDDKDDKDDKKGIDKFESPKLEIIDSDLVKVRRKRFLKISGDVTKVFEPSNRKNDLVTIDRNYKSLRNTYINSLIDINFEGLPVVEGAFSKAELMERDFNITARKREEAVFFWGFSDGSNQNSYKTTTDNDVFHGEDVYKDVEASLKSSDDVGTRISLFKNYVTERIKDIKAFAGRQGNTNVYRGYLVLLDMRINFNVYKKFIETSGSVGSVGKVKSLSKKDMPFKLGADELSDLENTVMGEILNRHLLLMAQLNEWMMLRRIFYLLGRVEVIVPFDLREDDGTNPKLNSRSVRYDYLITQNGYFRGLTKNNINDVEISNKVFNIKTAISNFATNVATIEEVDPYSKYGFEILYVHNFDGVGLSFNTKLGKWTYSGAYSNTFYVKSIYTGKKFDVTNLVLNISVKDKTSTLKEGSISSKREVEDLSVFFNVLFGKIFKNIPFHINITVPGDPLYNVTSCDFGKDMVKVNVVEEEKLNAGKHFNKPTPLENAFKDNEIVSSRYTYNKIISHIFSGKYVIFDAVHKIERGKWVTDLKLMKVFGKLSSGMEKAEKTLIEIAEKNKYPAEPKIIMKRKPLKPEVTPDYIDKYVYVYSFVGKNVKDVVDLDKIEDKEFKDSLKKKVFPKPIKENISMLDIVRKYSKMDNFTNNVVIVWDKLVLRMIESAGLKYPRLDDIKIDELADIITSKRKLRKLDEFIVNLVDSIRPLMKVGKLEAQEAESIKKGVEDVLVFDEPGEVWGGRGYEKHLAYSIAAWFRKILERNMADGDFKDAKTNYVDKIFIEDPEIESIKERIPFVKITKETDKFSENEERIAEVIKDGLGEIENEILEKKTELENKEKDPKTRGDDQQSLKDEISELESKLKFENDYLQAIASTLRKWFTKNERGDYGIGTFYRKGLGTSDIGNFVSQWRLIKEVREVNGATNEFFGTDGEEGSKEDDDVVKYKQMTPIDRAYKALSKLVLSDTSPTEGEEASEKTSGKKRAEADEKSLVAKLGKDSELFIIKNQLVKEDGKLNVFWHIGLNEGVYTVPNALRILIRDIERVGSAVARGQKKE